MPFLDEDGEIISRSHMERHLFSNKDMFRAVLYAKIDFSCETWSELSVQSLDFVKHLLRRDPTHRYTAVEALEHDWLKEGRYRVPNRGIDHICVSYRIIICSIGCIDCATATAIWNVRKA